MSRPLMREATAIRSSVPSGTRAVQETSPLDVRKVTRSPSRTERSRKDTRAARATSVRSGAMRTSSTRIEKARPLPRPGAGSFVATAGGSTGASGGSRTNGSKVAISWARPSSFTTKSSLVRPGTGRPSLSTTTASTVISSTWDGNVGSFGGSCARAVPA